MWWVFWRTGKTVVPLTLYKSVTVLWVITLYLKTSILSKTELHVFLYDSFLRAPWTVLCSVSSKLPQRSSQGFPSTNFWWQTNLFCVWIARPMKPPNRLHNPAPHTVRNTYAQNLKWRQTGSSLLLNVEQTPIWSRTAWEWVTSVKPAGGMKRKWDFRGEGATLLA